MALAVVNYSLELSWQLNGNEGKIKSDVKLKKSQKYEIYVSRRRDDKIYFVMSGSIDLGYYYDSHAVIPTGNLTGNIFIGKCYSRCY